MSEISETSLRSTFSTDKIAFYSFLLLVFSLGFMQPSVYLFKNIEPPSDFIFLATSCLWLVALLFRKITFRWHGFYWLLIFYFASMVVSTVFSIDPRSSFIKLLGECYLLGLAVLTFNFVRNVKQAKQVIYAWLAATAVCVFIGVLSLFLFYFDPDNWLLPYTRFHFGTLPPGNYLRLQSTFLNANMLCNYLSVGVMMLLVSSRLGWINRALFVSAFVGIMLCSLLTISPGLGGIAISLGVWYWIDNKDKRRFLAFTGLFCGIVLSAACLFAIAVSPNPQPDPPFHIDIPIVQKRIEPSARGLTWIDSWKTFTENPFTGRGLGQDACDVRYYSLSGAAQSLSDAHNVFLNVAAEQGIFGLTAILMIVLYLVRRSFATRAGDMNRDVLRLGIGIAFLSAFVYQGIGGSFEDARFLWVVIGLILSVTEMSELGSSAQ